MSDSTPIYNLKAVMQEVGLNGATLRAWELRYGLPKPHRTAGGHRLYSRNDIDMLKWLMDRQKEGLSISQAVEMWKVSGLATQIIENENRVPIAVSASEHTLDQLRDKWVAACEAFDEQASNQVLDQAFAIAVPETVCIEVLERGMARIGQGWFDRLLSVQQEHFASALAMRRVNTLLTAVPPATHSGRLLAACPPGEMHDFILLLVTYLLRRKAWDVVYLGANVPLKNLDEAIKSTRPALVLSAAQTLTGAASLRTMSEFLVQQGVSLAYGGGIFNLVPDTIQRIKGYYLGTSLAMVPDTVETLVMAPPVMPISPTLSPVYSQTLKSFLQNEAFIVSYVGSVMHAIPIEPTYLEIANDNLTQLIYSALILGDINLLSQSTAWLNSLLGNYGISTGVVKQFYIVYRQAVERYLGADGNIIVHWLTKQLMV
jgi:MerR family transcriptional regulator, light-induced transcriptional regulator